MSTAGPLLVRSNLVFGNTADFGGASFDSFDPNFYVTGNTIMSNSASASGSAAGLHLSAGLQSAVWISNNKAVIHLALDSSRQRQTVFPLSRVSRDSDLLGVTLTGNDLSMGVDRHQHTEAGQQ